MRRSVGFGAVAACIAAVGWFLPCEGRAQQTLFNVPSADVLEAGKSYFEEDNLWRSGRPKESYFTLRGVIGVGDRVEAGVNLGGFVASGRSVPTATVAVKWQPLHTSVWAVTVGAHGLFFFRGDADGSPSGHLYAHAAWTPRDGTRITAGGWTSTSGYADVRPTHGELAGFEQRIAPSLTFQTDWYSGRNALGYLTSGFALTLGRWVVYGGWSLKNGEPHENGGLVEVGLNL